MRALPTVLMHDMRLQWRYGIHLAYGVVIALYVAIITLARPFVPDWAIALLVYSDPSVLGAFFLGGLMLLERGEGVRTALAITPLSVAVYLAGKIVTLTTIAILAVIVLGRAHGSIASWPLLLATVALTSVHFIALGVPLALHFKTVNGYLIGSAGLLTPVVAPAGLALLPEMALWIAFVPAIAYLRLTLVAFGFVPASGPEIAFMLLVALAAALAMLVWAHRALAREIGRP